MGLWNMHLHTLLLMAAGPANLLSTSKKDILKAVVLQLAA